MVREALDFMWARALEAQGGNKHFKKLVVRTTIKSPKAMIDLRCAVDLPVGETRPDLLAAFLVVRITRRHSFRGLVEVGNESVMLVESKQDQQFLESLLCVLSCWTRAVGFCGYQTSIKHWWNSKDLL